MSNLMQLFRSLVPSSKTPEQRKIRSVAIIGGGASGAITLSALKAESVFESIKVFERRDGIGGVWRYDPNPPAANVPAGRTEKSTDPPLPIPSSLPVAVPPVSQERWIETPMYENLTTNVPAFAMTYSDKPFDEDKPYVHHSVVQRYLENYYRKENEENVVLGVTVEDLRKTNDQDDGWRLTLRRRLKAEDGTEKDYWWEEWFDAVVVATGHYHVPMIPDVPGLAHFQRRFPGVVEHSKLFRNVNPYVDKKVLVIGNRASGTDIVRDILPVAQHPVYNSRRHSYPGFPTTPPSGVRWKSPVARYEITTEGIGQVFFEDGTVEEGFDKIIYTTGYRYSYPFLRRYIPDISTGTRIVGTYEHIWYREDPTLTFVGSVIDAISFRAFEYQAIAVARTYAGRVALPDAEEMKRWEDKRLEQYGDTRAFHTIGLKGARDYWEKLVKIGKQVEKNDKGRRFPEAGDDFWKKLEEFVRKRHEGIGGLVEIAITPSASNTI